MWPRWIGVYVEPEECSDGGLAAARVVADLDANVSSPSILELQTKQLQAVLRGDDDGRMKRLGVPAYGAGSSGRHYIRRAA